MQAFLFYALGGPFVVLVVLNVVAPIIAVVDRLLHGRNDKRPNPA